MFPEIWEAGSSVTKVVLAVAAEWVLPGHSRPQREEVLSGDFTVAVLEVEAPWEGTAEGTRCVEKDKNFFWGYNEIGGGKR